ncbi:hypothetical protein Hanom_Chr05g00447271 [Helianthus anomalus]
MPDSSYPSRDPPPLALIVPPLPILSNGFFPPLTSVKNWSRPNGSASSTTSLSNSTGPPLGALFSPAPVNPLSGLNRSVFLIFSSCSSAPLYISSSASFFGLLLPTTPPPPPPS